MPRREARVQVSIWDDEDFLALPMDAQRYYLMVSSQAGMSHAGVVTVPRREWTNLSGDDDAADRNHAARKVLEEREFIAVDDGTDELLVRAMLRRDSANGPPGTFRGAMDAVIAVRSKALKAILRGELLRLDRAAIEAKNAANGESCISAYRRALRAVGVDPDDPPPAPRRPDEPVQTTIDDAVDNPSEPVGNRPESVDNHGMRMAHDTDATSMPHGSVVVDVGVDHSRGVGGTSGGSRAPAHTRTRGDPPPRSSGTPDDPRAVNPCGGPHDPRRSCHRCGEARAAARDATGAARRAAVDDCDLCDELGQVHDPHDTCPAAVICDHHTSPAVQLARARGTA